MVQRNSQELDINTGASAMQQQSGAGFKSPDANQYMTGHDISTPGQQHQDILLDSLLGVGSKLATQLVDKSREEAYLDGVAKAGTIQNESELDANVFTRNWAEAGYRDTMGRVAAADNASRIAVDMATMRQQSPAKFQEYMAQRRAELLPSMEGMSLQARKGMFATMLLDERAQIKQHGAQHAKFIVETQQQALTSQMDMNRRQLDVSKVQSITGGTEVYKAATDSTFAQLLSSTVYNPNLPRTAIPDMLKQVANEMLHGDHQLMYEKMRDTVTTLHDGTQGTLLSLLPSDDRAQLAEQYRHSLDRTAGFKNTSVLMELTKSRASWSNPNVPFQTYEQMATQVEAAHMNGAFGPAGKLESVHKRDTYVADYLSAAVTRGKSTGLSNAFTTGDQDELLRLKGTRTDSVNAYMAEVLSKGTTPEAVFTLIGQGMRTGWAESFHAAGVLTAPAWAQLASHDTIDPANATMVKQTLTTIDKAEQEGKAGMMQAYIGSFDQRTQDMIMLTRSNLRRQYGATEAIHMARTALQEATKVGGSGMTTAMRSVAEKEDAASLTEMQPMSMFGSGWNAMKSLVSGKAAAAGKLASKSEWFGNPEREAEGMATAKSAVAEEMAELRMTRPWLDAEARKTIAGNAVAARTVVTPWGPLSAPKGQTVESFFGVKDGERVGKALGEMLKPAEGNRVIFDVDVNGSLMYTEKDSDGIVRKAQSINPRAVVDVVQHQREAESARYNVLSGAGVTTNVKVDGKDFPITYNGTNALGVDPQAMLELRARIIKHEGATDTAKPDIGGSINSKTGKPVMTVGPGLSDTGTHYPTPDANGKITPKQASDGLRDASEEAAKVATRWMKAGRGSDSPKLFQLYSELAYQGGGFNKAINPVLVAVGNRNYPAAKAALQATPAYKMAGDSERRKFYDAYLMAAMKE